ncbi:16S rRNA (guanine(527)-N(7))-methyltransferase RsmG [Clostridium sp. AN503]|uniref:16S rRNA (guanine(527)-N(7))-methyltransferase RsmG n=1 Tax=Clostridium sp. AN503 TaxID=3160598 RepID=UPI0034579B9B
MEQYFVDKMTDGAKSLGITLSEKQLGQFYQYYELLIEWNKVMNLTAITELDEVISKHFIDSLSLIRAVKDLSGLHSSVIDVGTGAGFPGIPLKIAFPELKLTLLDSLNKRIKFLNEVIEKLGLDKIETIHGRAEDYGRDVKYREQFDFCVSRAVANAATLSEYCLPFVRVGGCFVPYKSGRIDEELETGRKAIRALGGDIEEIIRFELAEAEADRALVVIKKVEKTGKRYPRKAGVPSKEPIG